MYRSQHIESRWAYPQKWKIYQRRSAEKNPRWHENGGEMWKYQWLSQSNIENARKRVEKVWKSENWRWREYARCETRTQHTSDSRCPMSKGHYLNAPKTRSSRMSRPSAAARATSSTSGAWYEAVRLEGDRSLFDRLPTTASTLFSSKPFEPIFHDISRCRVIVWKDNLRISL